MSDQEHQRCHTFGHATRHARVVLSDCEESLLELRAASQDTLRRRWVATITLLRAVGHVLLEEEPTQASSVARSVMREEPDAAIFWGFIKKERDTVLKTDRFAVRGSVTIAFPPPGTSIPPRSGNVGIATDPLGTAYKTSTFTLHRLTDGPFAGEEPIAVVQKAITFWHTRLDEIDRRVSIALVKEQPGSEQAQSKEDGT